MKLFRVTLLLMVFFALPVQAQEARPADAQTPETRKYADWMTYYYMEKPVDEVVDYLAWLQYSGFLNDYEGTAPAISAFLAVVFTDNPGKVAEWLDAVKLSGRPLTIVKHALWLSGNTDLLAKRLGKLEDYMKTPSPGVLLTKPSIPSDLDMYWGAFSASGDTAYVTKVIDALKEFEKPIRNSNKTMDIRAAAAWSLGANMSQHELVARAVEQEIKVRPDAIKIVLNDQLENFRRKAVAFDTREGEFSARLLVLDEQAQKDYGAARKNAAQQPRPSTTTKVASGELLAVKVQFSGMQLTQTLAADVKYDIRLMAPDGSVYPGSELTGIAALEGRVPSRFRVFTTPSSQMIQFEASDKPGIYKITGEIRDNVGQKRVSLSHNLELAHY